MAGIPPEGARPILWVGGASPRSGGIHALGWPCAPGSIRPRRKPMSVLKTNPVVFFWRWIRYKITKWQMRNVDPMYPDIIKYVKDKNDFESTYGTGW
jgi:hypothetical protein